MPCSLLSAWCLQRRSRAVGRWPGRSPGVFAGLPVAVLLAGAVLPAAVTLLDGRAVRAAQALPLAVEAAAPAPAGAAESLRVARSLGVLVVERGDCGGPAQLATYNMGLNELCLGRSLMGQPALRDRVIHHELVHVVQDCLDGLDSPTSLTLAEGLRATGAFSSEQLAGFFLRYLRAQGNLQHVVATTASLPQDSRQREFEAYALQADPALVRRLLSTRCRPMPAPI